MTKIECEPDKHRFIWCTWGVSPAFKQMTIEIRCANCHIEPIALLETRYVDGKAYITPKT